MRGANADDEYVGLGNDLVEVASLNLIIKALTLFNNTVYLR
jgi:hypothetical protein